MKCKDLFSLKNKNQIVQSVAHHRKIPMLVASVATSQTAGQTRFKVSHPYEGKSCSKFGLIPFSGLGDSMSDRWTDR